MLPRIVLFALQLLAAWGIAEWFVLPIVRNVPALGRPYDVFVYAAIYTLIVMVVGYTGSLVLKGVGKPSGSTLIVTFILAMAFAGLTQVPAVTQVLHGAIPMLRTNLYLYPLLGAFIGYYIKR